MIVHPPMRFASGQGPSEYTPLIEIPPSTGSRGTQVILSELIWSDVRPEASPQKVNEEVVLPKEMVSVYVQEAEPDVAPLPPGPVPPLV